MALVDTLKQAAHVFNGTAADYDPILSRIADEKLVLIGEASHGTHEFYQTRADITKRLITEKGFTAVVAEADFPDAYRVNRYIRHTSDDRNAGEALGDFMRFPLWMWRNTVMVEFVEWLREFNQGKSKAQQVGFYGMDLYSMYTSMQKVIEYLDEADPEAAQRARYRYSCFDHFGEDPQSYGYAASFGMNANCEKQVYEQLVELQRGAADLLKGDGELAWDGHFFAEQNARLVDNAEEYYRTMYSGRVSSWNLRDKHMVETLDELFKFLTQHQTNPKMAVWAHNSHLGDARFTEMGGRGEWNVGQLVRQQWGETQAKLIGFTTYTGTVTAASNWDEPAQRKAVRPGIPDSYERLFHEVGIPRFLLSLRERSEEHVKGLMEERLERAIGVIYRPETERISHYFYSVLPRQFDVVIHLDETRALEPLDRDPHWEEIRQHARDTYPFGV